MKTTLIHLDVPTSDLSVSETRLARPVDEDDDADSGESSASISESEPSDSEIDPVDSRGSVIEDSNVEYTDDNDANQMPELPTTVIGNEVNPAMTEHTMPTLIPPMAPALTATTQTEFNLGAPPTRRGRIRKTRDMGKVTACICGETVVSEERKVGSKTAVECGYRGCETAWVCELNSNLCDSE